MTFTLGYLMGIIVGEGSFTRGPRLCVGLHERDPEPIRALQEWFGGRTYGPYYTVQKSGITTAQWEWQLTGRDLWKALPTFDEYLPRSHKRIQYQKWKDAHGRWRAYHARQTDPSPAPKPTLKAEMPSRAVQAARRAARASRKPNRSSRMTYLLGQAERGVTP
jgi:hypothetical protein